MAISPMEKVMQKSEFFTHLNRIGAMCIMFKTELQAEVAEGAAIKCNILVQDSKNVFDQDNPIMVAILGLASEPFTCKSVAQMEAAWEYF
jgi:hypothetical protein